MWESLSLKLVVVREHREKPVENIFNDITLINI